LRVRVSTASGSERASHRATLATARGTDLARLPVHAIVNRYKGKHPYAELQTDIVSSFSVSCWFLQLRARLG